MNAMRPRRFLPSISLLVAFEATVRNRSVTDAAHELTLTQSTVSRLIRSLEEQLGQTLFIRQNKRLVPTEAALAYQRDLTHSLDRIQSATMAVVANPHGGSLSLAVLPTFGTRWLAPRLPQFLASNPGVSINLSTRFERFSFIAQTFDAVIFHGQPNWPQMLHAKLFEERLTACASREYLSRHPIERAGDLEPLVLLHLETRPTAWSAWFAAQGHEPRRPPGGMIMDQFAMMIQAAICGMGVALLPDYLAQVEIAEGRLVPILRPASPSPDAYWLAWPENLDTKGPLVAFRAWLGAEVAQFQREANLAG